MAFNIRTRNFLKLTGKNIALIFIFFFSFTRPAFSAPGVNKQINYRAVEGLIERVAPNHTHDFIIENLPCHDKQETFELESHDGKIVLRGNTTLAITKAFNYYLNNYCHTSVSWYLAEPIEIPALLPPINGTIRESCHFQKRFFLNYCTFGYTMVWWRWDNWQRLIDWMALNGINMPLALTGEEYIWEKVWKKFGLSNKQIRAFFTGPAHLPWNRMGNIDGWMGPLPQSFIDNQFKLQKKILARERSFGMTPVLPAFAGHTPKVIKDKYPKVKLTNMGSFSVGAKYNAYFLNPTNPLFRKIQETFIKEQTKYYGTDHLYGADPFNEMTPPSWKPNYLASVSRAIYNGISAVDSNAVWVQMGWTFYRDSKHWTNPRLEAMIKAVPKNHMILLDYFCEKKEVWRMTHAFFGAPYIWCYLGNFGGGTQMAAPMLKVAKLLRATEADTSKGQMTGIGSTLEGFGVNSFMFDWIFDYAWDTAAANTSQWITRYADSRTGHTDPVVEDAWRRLSKLTYNNQISGTGPGNTVEMRPRFVRHDNFAHLGTPYNYGKLADIFSEMLLADSESMASPRYQYDLVMVCRQVLVNLAFNIRNKVYEAYKANNMTAFDKYSSLFLNLVSDVDRIVSTQKEFSFDDWIRAARSFKAPDAPASYFEKNAKVLVTTWGQQGNYLIDYAARDFSGLIDNYYKKRWEIFFNTVRKDMQDSIPFNQAKFDKNIAAFEWRFCMTPYKFHHSEKIPPQRLVRKFYEKWVKYFVLMRKG